MTMGAAELGERKAKLHVVVLPYPAKGHSIPFLHFAKRLHSMDVVVTFVNTFNHLSKEHFRTLDGLQDSATMRVVPLGDTPKGGEGAGTLPYVKLINDLVPDGELLMTQLFSEHQVAPPSCIVSDMFMGWTQGVANKFRIPRYALFASPATGLAMMLHMPELVRQGRLPVDPSKKEELVLDIPGVPPTRMADLPTIMHDATAYNYPFYAKNAEGMHEAKGVLINTFYELESCYIDVLRRTVYGNVHGQEGHLLSILPVGPMLPKVFFSTKAVEVRGMSNGMSDPCLEWLDSQPDSSVVYVSFGSVAVLSIPQIQELVRGLEASGERFLLAVRPPENPENLPLLPEGMQERMQGRGYVHMGWAPQLYVLSHPAVAAFVSHCGWNSSLESISRGVPMLAWPIQAEQAMNARFLIDDVKVAIELCRVTDKFVTKDQISKAISLMNSPEGQVAKANILKLKEAALIAVQEGGSVQKNLENFLQELGSCDVINV